MEAAIASLLKGNAHDPYVNDAYRAMLALREKMGGRDLKVRALEAEVGELNQLLEEKADPPRMNKRGTGWHGADRIKKMGQTRADILLVMQGAGCYDWRTGMTNDSILEGVRNVRELRQQKPPKDGHSLGGRLSELQGLRLIASQTNVVQLLSWEEQKFRTPTDEERWFLTEAGRMIEPESETDPRLVLQSHDVEPPVLVKA